MLSDAPQTEEIYTVSRLNNAARFLLEDAFPLIWIEGEISNFAAPNSGHWYFSLKDQTAQVRCAMFKGNKRNLTFVPKDGMHVLLRARVSMYEQRGEFQLIAETMEERGEGKLQRAFEELKKKLQLAGLFNPEHKKAIPTFPQQIGVITSATGAAIRDILTVLRRRFPCVPVIIYPTLVQGATAAPTIVNAIQTANERKECDVLILARGGGSLEDLWPFNEEIVAKAIFTSQLPIISAIGHEIDYTIADFVADIRAPTPSAAAEIATPDMMELKEKLARQEECIWQRSKDKLHRLKEQLGWVEKHLAQQHPKRKLQEKMQRLDYFEITFAQLITRLLSKKQKSLNELDNQLRHASPTRNIHLQRQRIAQLQHQMNTLVVRLVNAQKHSLASHAAKLDALSPLATLQRGYAIVTDSHDQLITRASQVKLADKVQVKLQEGELVCEVKECLTVECA